MSNSDLKHAVHILINTRAILQIINSISLILQILIYLGKLENTGTRTRPKRRKQKTEPTR